MTPRAIVVGGGIGGLSAALALAAEGFSVTVLEQSSALGDVGAGIQLSPNATRVLHHLGLEAPLRGIAFLPEGTEMRSWRRGHVIATAPLGAAVRGVQQRGAPGGGGLRPQRGQARCQGPQVAR